MTNKKSIQNKLFNEDRLLNYVKTFSFPRLAGSEGEKKAVELTVETFENIGFKTEQIIQQPFEFSDFYSTTLIKLIMTINLTFYLILVLFVYISPVLSYLTLVGMAILVFLIVKGLKHPEMGFWGEYFGDTYSATNVFVKLPAKDIPVEKAGNIIISAHLDSKSQSIKTAWRVVFYRIWLFSGIFLGGFYLSYVLYNYLINPAPNIILDIGIWSTTILTALSNIVLFFVNTHNKSPGALDNATGMAILFDLSNWFRENPLNNFNLWLLFTSAEEMGTMGARSFVNKYEDQFEKGRVFQINMDMISSATHKPTKNRIEYLKSYGIFPRKKIAPLLSRYLDKAASEEKITIHGFHLTVGAHTDSVPFHLRGFSAVDITTKAAAIWAHNKEDTPDKVDPKILKKTCITVRKAILKLDEDYDMLCGSQELMCEEN